MDIYWNGDKIVTFASHDGTGPVIVYQETATETQPGGQWLSLAVSIRLDANNAWSVFTYYGGPFDLVNNPITYPASWTLSMNPKIFICSDMNSLNPIKCQVTNVKMWYETVSGTSYINPVQVRDGVIPKLIAQYKMNQHSGYVINDSTNTLGPAYFGSSTQTTEDLNSANMPSWMPETDLLTGKLLQASGIQFDQSTEYITLPTFMLAEATKTPSYSFTIKLWFKLSEIPSVESYLFRYFKPTIPVDIVALIVKPDGMIGVSIYSDLSIEPNEVLSTTEWNLVVFTFTFMKYMTAPSSTNECFSIVILINSFLETGEIQKSAPPSYVYDSSDIVRIGGPPSIKGVIAGVEIYSPGTVFFNAVSACQSSTCERDLGLVNPPMCAVPVCPVNCDVCLSSQEAGCLSCAPGHNLYESRCVLMPCSFGKYLDGGGICQSCSDGCDVCPDSTSCTTCKAGFIRLQNSTCVCPPGSYFDVVNHICKANNYPCDNSSYFFYHGYNYCKPKCRYPFKTINEFPISSCVLDIDEKDADLATQVTKVSTTATDTVNMGGMLSLMLNFNNPALLLAGSLTEMLQYIQYLRIDYPPKVYLMLEEQNVNSGGLNIITEIPEEVAKAIPNRPLPEEFEKNDTHSSFIANTWELLITLSATIVSIGIIFTIKPCMKSLPRVDSFLSKLLQSLKWNFFLGVFCSSYGFAGMYTALEFRSVNMSSGLSILSFIVSLIINTLGFFIFFLIAQLSVTLQTIKKTFKSPEEQTKNIEETEEKWKDYGVLFVDYKNNFVSQTMYLFIFMLRTYVHYAFLGYLNDHPFIQTCCFTVISIAMILYMITRRPLKSLINYVQQMLCECAILVVNVCVLILAIMEKWDIVDYDQRVTVGDVILLTNLVLSVATSVFLGIEIISQAREAYLFIKKWRQNMRSSKKRTISSLKIKKSNHNIPSRPVIADLNISALDRINETSVDQLNMHE